MRSLIAALLATTLWLQPSQAHAQGVARPQAAAHSPSQAMDGACLLDAFRAKSEPFWGDSSNLFATHPSSAELGIDPENPDWRKLQFTDPGQQVDEYARLYVKNVTSSIIEKFAPAFESGRIITDFRAILREEHRVLIMGDDPARPYRGWFKGARQNAETIAGMAGQFRSEDGYLPRFALWLPGVFGKKSARLRPPDPVIKIEGIPEEALPTNDVLKLEHQFPDARYLGYYLDRMGLLMSQIRSCDSCSRLQLIEKLADYYHVAINSHAFPRVNQSLFMSQVNYILRRAGIKGLRHASPGPAGERLDALALVLGGDEFRRYFVHQVLNDNPISEPVTIH